MNDTTANNDPGREQLSAFLDDELTADEARFLLRRLEADPALARHLHQYAAIGEVLRGNAASFQGDLVERVQRAIHGESMPEAQPDTTAAPATAEHWSASLMPLARVAAAAAVAAVVVFAVLPRAPGTTETFVSTGGGSGDDGEFPVVPPVTPADGPLVGVPGNAAFASYLLKHTSAVNTSVRPDFVAAQRAYDHLHPASPPAPAEGAEEEAAAQDQQR